jgi:hypothetical protein
MFAKNKGFKGAVNPVDFVISIVIVVIIIAAVAIPTINDVLNDAGITGIPQTVLAVIPTFLRLLALVMIARGF